MTVENVLRKNIYITDGLTSVFVFGFAALSPNDIKAELDVGSGLVPVTDFTVSLNVNQTDSPGGVITFDADVPVGTLIVLRDVIALQNTKFGVYSRFPSGTIEASLDLLTMLYQQLDEENDRSLKLSIADEGDTSVILPPYEADRIIGWDPVDKKLANKLLANLGSVVIGTGLNEVPYAQDITLNNTRDTIALLKAVINIDIIKEGALVHTVDNNSTKPGGGASYLVKTTAQAISDGDFVTVPDEKGNHTAAVSGLVFILQPVNNVVDVRQFGAVGNDATDDILPIQAAIDFTRRKDGGDVLASSGTYLVSDTVLVWERVRLFGVNGTARNFFQDNTHTTGGTTIKLKAGTNKNVIEAVVSINFTPNPFPVETNVDKRHMGGVTNLCIDGNRSVFNDVTQQELNNLGNGLVFTGVNLFECHDVVVTRCAENGVLSQSNGDADGQCNNLYLHHIYVSGCSDNGFNLSGGDSNCTNLWGIQNGINGLTSSMEASSFSASTFNDNAQNGMYSSGEDTDLVNVRCYHNRKNGFIIDAEAPSVVGCKARHNGMNDSFADTDRCGFVFTSNANNYVIDGCASYDDGLRGDPFDLTQQYGFRLLNSGNKGVWGSNYAFDNQTADYSFQNSTQMTLHNGATASFEHPGFKAIGSVNVNGNQLQNIGGITHDSPQTISSISANVLSVSANTLLTLNVSGGATINDIANSFTGLGQIHVRNINAAAVTFTASGSINTKDGANIVLTQGQARSFMEFAADVWFEI